MKRQADFSESGRRAPFPGSARYGSREFSGAGALAGSMLGVPELGTPHAASVPEDSRL
jgi:hypothetical protein